MIKKIIYHIDVNSAFLSWEAARRVALGEPDLRLIPSIVGGDPARRGSIVAAKSIPAKKYGINTGEPVSMAMRKCPNLVVVPSDHALYKECSHAFIEICQSYSDILEQFSIDECFLDMTQDKEAKEDPVARARALADEIKDRLGFTVNIGISENKLLAKMASDFEKPDKVHTLWPEEIISKMWPLPVRDLLFVGKSSAARLNSLGIKTIGDLANCNRDALCCLVGEKTAKAMIRSANGRDDSPVSGERGDAKSFSIATTPDDDIVTYEDADRILSNLADTVCFRMRKDGAKAFCVGINIRTTDFNNKSHQKQLLDATDITSEVLEVCKVLLRQLWNNEPLRLIGISLSNLSREDFEQVSLFDDEKKEKARKLDKALDSLRVKHGAGIVKRAREIDSGNSRNG